MLRIPYIKRNLRKAIVWNLGQLEVKLDEEFAKHPDKLASVVAYIFFTILKDYYATGHWYDRMDAIKILESVKYEFLRRFIAPYEDKKIKWNGDV